jgi:hypothetical protein
MPKQHPSSEDNADAFGSTLSDVGMYANPNVVLVHAGTNDINRNIDVLKAPERLSNLVGAIFKYAPDAVILIAQIIPSKPSGTYDRDITFNAAIPSVVADWVSKDKHVYTVDMFDGFDRNADLADDLHPNSAGYTLMAQKWYNAILAVDQKGWIQEAGPEAKPPHQQCQQAPLWTGDEENLEIATGPSMFVALHVSLLFWHPFIVANV